MTKYFIRLLLLIACIVALLAIIGSLLPRSYRFVAQITIDAPPEKIFPEINQISNWRDWSPWNPAEVPDLTVEYSGNESGVGSTQTWTEPRGKGKLWITSSTPPQQIDYKMQFANFPEMSSSIRLTPTDKPKGESEKSESTQSPIQTTVIWTNEGTLPGGPFYGIFAPFFSTQMRYVYDNSLQQLKQQVEKQ